MIDVDFVCDLDTAAGYSAHARMILQAFYKYRDLLEKAGIDIRAIMRRKESSVIGFTKEEADIYNSFITKTKEKVDIRIFFEPAHFVEFDPDICTVSWCQWETTKIRNRGINGDPRSDWVSIMNSCDYVLTSGSDARDAFVASGVKTPSSWLSGPIKEDIDMAELPVSGLVVDSKGSLIPRSERPYVIGYMAQWSPRKNIEAFIRDVTIAFSHGENVAMLIKTYKGAAFSDDEAIANAIRLVRDSCRVPNPPPIFTITEKLSDNEVERFFNVIDLYYCPSRGEGFNVPAALAVSAQKPVIATGYGGHCDFLNPFSLVPYSFSPCIGMPGAYDSDQFWANIDERKAIHYLQECYKGHSEDYLSHHNFTASEEQFVSKFIDYIKLIDVQYKEKKSGIQIREAIPLNLP